LAPHRRHGDALIRVVSFGKLTNTFADEGRLDRLIARDRGR